MATICLSAATIYYPKGGGHFWVYMNWALGFKKNNCDVIWLEKLDEDLTIEQNRIFIADLKNQLNYYGLNNSLALWSDSNNDSLADFDCKTLSIAAEKADFFLNSWYHIPKHIVKLFRKAVLLDIDPGQLQLWLSQHHFDVSFYDYYITTGETVGVTDGLIPDSGCLWHYLPPCVSLDYWPYIQPSPEGFLTTITHWWNKWEYDEKGIFDNSKRAGFMPYLNLPKFSPLKLQLAISLAPSEEEDKSVLINNGWTVENSFDVAGSPQQYQQYIQQSIGEFSCVKPSCIRLQNAWISDRTLCYFASGKPAIIEHTGPSKFLPDREGILRFKNFEEAVDCITEVERNYEQHCRHARWLAEEYFDAKKVTAKLLEIVL